MLKVTPEHESPAGSQCLLVMKLTHLQLITQHWDRTGGKIATREEGGMLLRETQKCALASAQTPHLQNVYTERVLTM